METFEAVRTMLAVRQFQDRPIPEDVVREIAEAAHLTASSNNGQPWHFVVVQNKDTLRHMGSLVRSGPYIAQAPLAVVASASPSPFGESDVSRAIQDMMLVAWSRGVGSNWTGFHGLDAIKQVVGLPADEDVIAVVPFGYPAKKVGAGKKKRKPLGDVVFRERFGQPFA